MNRVNSCTHSIMAVITMYYFIFDSATALERLVFLLSYYNYPRVASNIYRSFLKGVKGFIPYQV